MDQTVTQGGDWGYLVRQFTVSINISIMSVFNSPELQITRTMAQTYGGTHHKAWHTNFAMSVGQKASAFSFTFPSQSPQFQFLLYLIPYTGPLHRTQPRTHFSSYPTCSSVTLKPRKQGWSAPSGSLRRVSDIIRYRARSHKHWDTVSRIPL